MLEFMISLLILGKADINDNWHVYAGTDPRYDTPQPVIAIEYTVKF